MKQLISCLLFAFTVTSAYAQADAQSIAMRHGPMWPESVNGFVTKNQCLQCHGPYQALAQKTERKDAINPHDSHLGEVNCVECHQPQTAQPALMCNSCHKFAVPSTQKTKASK